MKKDDKNENIKELEDKINEFKNIPQIIKISNFKILKNGQRKQNI